MPTVQEVLKQSGLSDEQIIALDAKAINAFSGVLSAAEQAREQAAADAERAEVERRSNRQFYDQSIAPALDSWATERANLDGQLSFYKSQLESARASGLEFAEPPQARDGGGRYVAAAPGGTPGSPTFTQADVQRALSNGVSNIGWALQSYAKLHPGEVLPDDFDKLSAEADAQRLPFRDYVARKYDFAGKQAEQQRKAAEEHDAQIRRETEQANDRKWAEKIGSNPDIRIAQPSRFADVARAVRANERPDPLQLNEAQRRAATSQAIRKDIAEKDSAA
jgi:hypothetical protein